MNDLLCTLVFVFDVLPQLSLVIRFPDVVCKGIESTFKLRMKICCREDYSIYVLCRCRLLTPIAPTHIAAVKVEVLLKTPLYSPPSNPIVNPYRLKMRGDQMIRKYWDFKKLFQLSLMLMCCPPYLPSWSAELLTSQSVRQKLLLLYYRWKPLWMLCEVWISSSMAGFNNES